MGGPLIHCLTGDGLLFAPRRQITEARESASESYPKYPKKEIPGLFYILKRARVFHPSSPKCPLLAARGAKKHSRSLYGYSPAGGEDRSQTTARKVIPLP